MLNRLQLWPTETEVNCAYHCVNDQDFANHEPRSQVRICKTAKKLNIKTISIFSEADAADQHVREADEAVLLSDSNATAYPDKDNILAIAKSKNTDAIIPGYGFLF
ncbi:hypothetical protein P154DRAFT_623595 [Amniculicola lignicola CBS 123094]|uniref:Biotin carboxylation domain-containing protein n=1 Tax=Amniculicola lignicola CBS 123094 TaxID=1392246 RepID=A0A6A5W410_9PLEO|nr:hypothetical protein P154DRAFT_623595 [Amniculicola lignicola CBS 123094]